MYARKNACMYVCMYVCACLNGFKIFIYSNWDIEVITTGQVNGAFAADASNMSAPPNKYVGCSLRIRRVNRHCEDHRPASVHAPLIQESQEENGAELDTEPEKKV